MYKKDEKKITPVASTSVDPNLRAILDMMQHQNEEYQAAVNNLYKLIREEGAQGIKEIELIGKTMTEFELGDTSEFNSIITDDTNTSSRSTTQNTRITKHPVKRVRNEQTPEACDPTNYEDADKERVLRRPTLYLDGALYLIWQPHVRTSLSRILDHFRDRP
jgi:hypothetical protein